MKQFWIRLVSHGRGRVLAGVLLALMGVVLVYQDHTPLQRLRQIQFDQYQRFMPRDRQAEPVVVVGIDNRSIEQLGRWPWSRSVMAELVNKMTEGEPLAVGFDVIFSEPDHYSRGALSRQLPQLSAQTLKGLSDPDQRLADALFGEPTVLAAIGLSNALAGARLPAPSALARQHGKMLADLPVTRYPSALLSLPLFEARAAGMGVINAGVDPTGGAADKGVVRSVPALARLGEQPMLSLPLEMVRVAIQWKSNQLGPDVQVLRSNGELARIEIGEYGLPIQDNGEILLHFGRAKASYYVSAVDVIEGKHAGLFSNRFVLVGINTAFEDRIVSPLGENLPGVDAHVQVIESLLEGVGLKRPGWMRQAELAAFVLAGLLLLLAIPTLQARFALAAFAGAAVVVLGSGYLAFALGRWLFDGLSVAVFLMPGFMALLSSTLVAAERERKRAEEDLRVSRESAARMAGELDAARRIQLGLLPNPELIFAGEKRFSLSAILEPAKEVGGDYYDCFMLDERRLCLAVGDVSGKGVPASLFMAISKTLTGALTRRNADLGEAVQDVERELNRENSQFLFVTSFVAVLDVESGLFTYVCAGHDAPVVKRGAAVFNMEISDGGPPLCALGDFPYTAGETRLEAGDVLCMFTDGVTEAMDGVGLFGGEAVMRSLAGCPDDASTRDIMMSLHQAVRTFENGLPAADDLTVMLLRWMGPQA